MKRKLLLLLLSCAASFSALAQQTISGKVTDSDDGMPLPGVNVLEKGTTNGAVTDVNGQFSLSVKDDAVLILSYVGYSTQEVAVNGRSYLDIKLSTDVTQLSEVVVVGYGTQKKEDVTGSVTAISTKDFNKGAIASPQDLIKGRISGVQVTNAGGAPGSSSTIRIRGGSSLYASNDPLVVVDGVPLSNEGISGVRNPLSLINPNDIESVTVLKDASATAIYGARASNGVIMVTTKRGKAGSGMNINYSGNVSLYTIPKTVDVMSGAEYSALVNERVSSGQTAASALDLLGTANTDWQDQIFEQAIGTEHNVSLSGSMKAMPYRASVGYTNQDGILKTTNFERTTASIGLDPSLLDDHLKIHVNLKGALTNNRFADEGAIGSAVTFDPTQSPYDETSPYGGYFYWAQNDGNRITIAPTNPLALIEQRRDESDVKRYIANTQFEYNFHFLPELSANLNLAYDKSSSDGTIVVPETASFEVDQTLGNGRRGTYSAETKNELLEYYMKYKKELPSISSRIEVLGGYSWQHFYRENSGMAKAYLEETVKDSLTVDKSENYLVSFYGRMNYTFKDKYALTATVRRDGSSRFAEDNQFGTFISGAFAWNIKDEEFLKNVSFLSDLKLRVGYGETGQENVGPSYPAIPTITYSNGRARYPFGNTYYNTIRYNGYDANLKWEETVTYNAGVDFGFLDGRINGSFDYYIRKTDDLLNVIPIPIGTNFTNEILTNVGNLENKGLELSLNAILVDGDKFRWDAGFNLTRNQNKVTKLTAVDDPTFIGNLTGGIGGATGNNIQVNRVGESANSFFVYQQVYNEAGDPVEGLYVDQNEDGIINDLDRIVKENPAPKVYMGFSSNFSYGKLSLGFNARMNLGNYVYNNVASQYATYTNIYNPQGYLNNVSTSVRESGFNNPQYFSDYYIEDASFFRMDNMTLGYDVGRVGTDGLNLSLNFTVQNVFVVSKYDGLDPELSNGIDNNIYPRPRTFMLGVNFNFQK
ncbi:SusC/RagA family TonB-linked outer membrane protein [Fulvivirga ligni]|uniref:SusC/RagA family TonB-linked outer membrane protein n=1 Tax=Fulvivirga ligni TaxID=2904246 RepID=UPI001F20683A|nr:TonB-dependent receptor [Fulvivirga ligni]UII19217.1 TonB-dependent receptor [Fulvivirga ligni]